MASENSVESETTKHRLLEAAGQVFAAKGFEAGTVREICAAARVNLAAVNYHFGDKQRLYIEAVKRAHACRIENTPLPQWNPQTPPAVKLHEMIRTLLTRMLSGGPGWQATLMLRELAQPTAACEEIAGQYIRPHFEILLGIVAELVGGKPSLEERHRIAFSIVGQCLFYHLAAPIVRLLVPPEEFATYEPSRLADHIAQFSLAGLQAAGAQREAPR